MGLVLDWHWLVLGFIGLDWAGSGLELVLGLVHAIIFELLSIGAIGTIEDGMTRC